MLGALTMHRLYTRTFLYIGMYYLCFNSLLFGDASESVSKLLAGTHRCNDFIDHVIFVSIDARAN